ncbi:hypothetical protein FNO01nite_31010 [Flavobacterium noncentrifugens]|uniref:Uncharacterized protein n=1 Tax=Flavobacterium noncentrifugens TaxID=1128970 RepID=A0A1G9C0A7_9FLAO|nr:hypothetical protein [Flavobacterium noncentrifugens]GEP52429.1 hypothetical protein FNO01nite_31010 [Flavobacterium noncentrifugens]SDK45116.1 hypothetical protein SAMN04487935_3420 [Flavobacterium noncentrifugens]
MDIVTNYCVEYKSAIAFDVTFEIPNNCVYSQSISLKINYITVQLQPGQTVPSNIFVQCKVTIAPIDGKLSVYFVQICDGKTSNKPKVTVDNI